MQTMTMTANGMNLRVFMVPDQFHRLFWHRAHASVSDDTTSPVDDAVALIMALRGTQVRGGNHPRLRGT